MTPTDVRNQRYWSLQHEAEAQGLTDGYQRVGGRQKFDQSDFPGICRTCRYGLIRRTDSSIEPYAVCRLNSMLSDNGLPERIPSNIVKCSGYTAIERTKGLASLLDQALLLGPRPGIWAEDYDRKPAGKAGFVPVPPEFEEDDE